MLTRVLIDNFRALVNFEFRPGSLCLLLGENGSGKSSLIEAIACVADFIARGTPVANYLKHSRTRWESRDLQRFELDINGNGGTYRYILEIKHPIDSARPPVIHSEEVTFDGDQLFHYRDGDVHLAGDGARAPANFPFQPNQSFLANLDPQSTSKLGWFKGFMDRFRVVQPNPFGMNPTSKGDSIYLGRDCRFLASYFDYLNNERPESRAELEARLRIVLPGFRNFVLRRVGEEKLLLAVFNGVNDQQLEFGLLDLSEGQRVLIALYASLFGLLNSTSLVCFDEPDNFVSLSEVQPWLQALRDQLDESGAQAFLISHHPEVIDYLALDSAWRFERPSGPVIARPLGIEVPPGIKPSERIARGG